MPSAAATLSATMGGVSFSGAITRSGETPQALSVVLPAAKAGSLTTRTDNDTGVVTLSTGHSITTGMVVDVYWVDSSGDDQCRYNMDATVATNAVTVDGGAGANLPTATTAVTLCQRQIAVFAFTASIVQALLASSTRKASIRCMATSSVVVAILNAAGEFYDWFYGRGVTTPLGSDVTAVHLSNGDSAGTNTVSFGVILDSISAL